MLESIWERVAHLFEGTPTRADRWYADLLAAMSLEIDGVRPAVISPGVAAGLRELLGFRHFFRHAYAVDFDPAKLERLALVAVGVHPEVRAALDAFGAHLKSLAAS